MCAYQIPIGLGRLASAEVAERPSGIPEHAELVVLAQEVQQRPQSALLEDVVAALRAITSNVTQGPHSLLPYIGNGRREQFDELRDGLCVDDDLGMFCRTRSDVGQSPSSLELLRLLEYVTLLNHRRAYLKHSIVSPEELHEAGHDTTLNDALNRGVLFF